MLPKVCVCLAGISSPQFRFSVPLFLALSLLIINTLSAQDRLYLEKPPFKRQMVQPGDSLRLEVAGIPGMVGARFIRAKDSTIYTTLDSFPLQDIGSIWILRGKNSLHWLRMMRAAGISMAIIFPPLMALDALTRNRRIESGDWIRIGTAASTGLLMNFLFKRWYWKRFTLGKKWFLAIRVPVEDSVGPAAPQPQGREDP